MTHILEGGKGSKYFYSNVRVTTMEGKKKEELK